MSKVNSSTAMIIILNVIVIINIHNDNKSNPYDNNQKTEDNLK